MSENHNRLTYLKGFRIFVAAAAVAIPEVVMTNHSESKLLMLILIATKLLF